MRGEILRGNSFGHFEPKEHFFNHHPYDSLIISCFVCYNKERLFALYSFLCISRYLPLLANEQPYRLLSCEPSVGKYSIIHAIRHDLPHYSVVHLTSQDWRKLWRPM